MAEEQSKSIATVRENPCPICSGMTFIWGVTVGESPSQRLYTRPDGAGWGEGKEMVTRECNTCGNVQLFTRVYTSNE
ncbi:MAG: hypothetical protein ABI970_04825 [Chloroflexota bacterium]